MLRMSAVAQSGEGAKEIRWRKVVQCSCRSRLRVSDEVWVTIGVRVGVRVRWRVGGKK